MTNILNLTDDSHWLNLIADSYWLKLSLDLNFDR